MRCAAAGGRGCVDRASALRRTSAAGGQTVHDHHVDRLPRLAAARAPRHTLRPRRRTPKQCHAPDSTCTEQDGSRSRCACAPGSAKHSTGASRLAHAGSSSPAPCKSHAHPRQATCRSRRPLHVWLRILRRAADSDARRQDRAELTRFGRPPTDCCSRPITEVSEPLVPKALVKRLDARCVCM